MATLGSQGLVDDGSDDLTVRGTTTLGVVLRTAATLTSSGSVTISDPGFYYVAATGSSGEGYFTGSVPNPNTCPGTMLMITDTFGVFNWLLTGSSYRTGKALFVKMSGSNPGVAGGTGYGGDRVNLSPSGSIQMLSDGFRWCIIGGSGSAALAGVNL